MKVATHLNFAECCWFATSAVFDVHYEIPAVLAAAATSILLDADYPKSWLGHQIGSISEDLNRLFGHRSFLHSLLALMLVTLALGLPLWWITGWPSPMIAVGVGYSSHLFADMMTSSSNWDSPAPPPSPTPSAASSSGCERRPRREASACGAPAMTLHLPAMARVRTW